MTAALPAQAYYGAVTRNFVTTFMHQLSLGASRCYLYLRTWCFGPAGEVSPWRTITVTKIAKDLDLTTRYVRKAIAELVGSGLVERKAQHNGEARGQIANAYRILPEPGYPHVSPPVEQGGTARKADPELAAMIVAETEQVVAATTAWARDAADEALKQSEVHEETAAQIEHGSVPWDVLTEPERAEKAAEQHAEAAAQDNRAMVCGGLSDVPPAQIACHPLFYKDVVSTVAHRVLRRLMPKGRRTVRHHNGTPQLATIEPVVRQWLIDRGEQPPA